MDALIMLVKAKEGENGAYEVLADTNKLQASLNSFDPDVLTTDEINLLSEIVGAPEFTIARIKAESEAAVTLA